MMAVDTPTDSPAMTDDDEIKTPRFDLAPYARSVSTGAIKAAVALENEETRECAIRMFKNFNAEDYLLTLDAAEELLADNPRHALANACAHESRSRIERDYALSPAAVPCVIATPAELGAAHLDHREGFLLSLVDGVLAVEQLSDVSGMSGFDLLRTFAKLRRLGLVRID